MGFFLKSSIELSIDTEKYFIGDKAFFMMVILSLIAL